MPVESTSPVEFGKQKTAGKFKSNLPVPSYPFLSKTEFVQWKINTSQRSVSFTKLESSLLNHESGVLEVRVPGERQKNPTI